MATIHGKLQFGVRLKVKAPFPSTVGEAAIKMAMGVAEAKFTEVLSLAISTLKILPGLEIGISEAASKIEVEKIEP
jgi:hypothetical protein